MEVYRQNDFTGGENRRLLPEFIRPNQLVLAQNCEMTDEGLVQTRKGKVKINTTTLGAGDVISAVRWAKEDGTKYLTVQHGTSLYSRTWDGVSQFTDFGAAIKTGLTADKLRYVVWRNNLIAYSAGVNAFRYDGTTVADLAGSPPRFIHLVLYANRLWGIDAANPNQVRYSGLENYGTWDALDIINVRSGDGDKLAALAPVSGGMLLCKTRNIFPLYGTNRLNISIGEPISEAGCISTDGVLAGLIMGADNWYFTNLSSIQPIPETHSVLLEKLTFAQKQSVFSASLTKERKAFYTLPSGEVVVLDGKRNAITSWRGLGATCFAVAEAVGDTGVLLCGGAGHIYMVNGLDDDGTPIETYLKLSYMDYNTGFDKEWRVFWPKLDILDSGDYEIFLRYDVDYAMMKGQTTVVGVVPDYLEWGVEDWGSAAWGTGNNSLETPYWFHTVRGEYISFEIRSLYRLRFRGYESRYRIMGRKS